METHRQDDNDVERENVGAAVCKPKKRNWQANQEWIRVMIRFVSNTIKWLTPNKEQHGEKILACCHISPVEHKPIHMKNET